MYSVYMVSQMHYTTLPTLGKSHLAAIWVQLPCGKPGNLGGYTFIREWAIIEPIKPCGFNTTALIQLIRIIWRPKKKVLISNLEAFPVLTASVSLLPQVEPMFARQLLYFAGQTNGHYLRGYEIPTQGPLPVEDYQRSLQHMQEWTPNKETQNRPP